MSKGRTPEEALEAIYARGRDNARTPMQWTDGENAGFSDGEPWLPVNRNCLAVNARAALADQDSVFYFYQRLIALRKTYPVFRDGAFTLLDPEDEKCFAYTRDAGGEHLSLIHI